MESLSNMTQEDAFPNWREKLKRGKRRNYLLKNFKYVFVFFPPSFYLKKKVKVNYKATIKAPKCFAKTHTHTHRDWFFCDWHEHTPLWAVTSPCLCAPADPPAGGWSSRHQPDAWCARGPPRLPLTTDLCSAAFPVTSLLTHPWRRKRDTVLKTIATSQRSGTLSCPSLSSPGVQSVFLRVYPQLHLLHRLPQEEELFNLTLVFAVETQEVLLCHFLKGEAVTSQEPRLGVIGLEELVKIPLDSELVL